MKKEQLEKLAAERNNPCVTISMNTHRTHPDNDKDAIILRNLLKECETRLLDEFDEEKIKSLLKKIKNLEKEIDVNYNSESLHIFLSENTKEIIRSPWPESENSVHIAERFSIRPLIKIYNRTEDYLILLLSKEEAKLFYATNGNIEKEIINDTFPFKKEEDQFNKRTNEEKLIDGKHADNITRHFFNEIDKATVRIHKTTQLNYVVVSTEDNFSFLMQVADKPEIYLGHCKLNYKDISNRALASSASKTINSIQEQKRLMTLRDMKEAVGSDKVITDLPEIFKAVKEGRGDVFIAHENFRQPVRMTGEFTFETVDDVTKPGVIDDITSDIAWEVISKKGHAIFTDSDEIKSLGDVALKIRF